MEATTSVHKYQVAFDVVPNIDELNLDIKSYSINGRIVTLFTKDDYETFSNKINVYNPLLIDEIQIDF